PSFSRSSSSTRITMRPARRSSTISWVVEIDMGDILWTGRYSKGLQATGPVTRQADNTRSQQHSGCAYRQLPADFSAGLAARYDNSGCVRNSAQSDQFPD